MQEGDGVSLRCWCRVGWDVVLFRAGEKAQGCVPIDLEGLARELGCMVGATDLGRPGGQHCAESRLPGGRGCCGCQLLSAPGDAGAQRPRMGPIYSEEPGGCRHGPVLG